MARPVRITVHTRQTLFEESAVLSRYAAGTLEQTQTGFLLRYTEREENGPSTENTFLLADTCAILTRTGAVTGEMRFSPGRDTDAPYRTAYGAFALTLHTDYYRHALSEAGGRVMLRYTLSAQGSPIGSYTLKLHITEKDD